MGLTVALGNALSGLKANSGALEIISRNISNAGTPGYHKQSLNVIEIGRGNNSYVRTGEVSRAFDQTLQSYYSKQVPETAYANTQASYLDRLQTALGKPGAAGSLDKVLGGLQTSLDKLATSPDNYAARADVVAKAQAMAGTLNSLSQTIQGMRQETETRMASGVGQLNEMLSSLEGINAGLADFGLDGTTRVGMLDQRDRLVAGISEMVDVRVQYRDNGSVAISTKSGASLLDVKASRIEFTQGGSLNATSELSADGEQSGVGQMMLVTPSGVRVDLVQDGAVQSGTLGALVELRDTTLQEAQRQLDDIAGALAKAFSTVQTPGTSVAGGTELELGNIADGDDFLVKYTDASGAAKTARVVRVDDGAKLPLASPDADGNQVVGVDFHNGGTALDVSHIASTVQAALGAGSGLALGASASGTALQITASAPGANVASATARWTATSANGGAGQLGLPMFVDAGGKAFTGALGGQGQSLGFAARISVNAAVVADNNLLVRYDSTTASGDAKRADYLVDQFKSLRFTSNSATSTGGFKLNGTLSQMVGQTLEYQGSTIASALSKSDTQTLALGSLTQRMDETYGVDVNEEVSRLMELQNSYAANARVVSIVQELLESLMSSVR